MNSFGRLVEDTEKFWLPDSPGSDRFAAVRVMLLYIEDRLRFGDADADD